MSAQVMASNLITPKKENPHLSQTLEYHLWEKFGIKFIYLNKTSHHEKHLSDTHSCLVITYFIVNFKICELILAHFVYRIVKIL